jgi:hypothetical protein
MDKIVQLYNKMSAEYTAFIDNLKRLPSEAIIDRAYEKVTKEDILSCFAYNESFKESELAALLALEYPLDDIYEYWRNSDYTNMDDLRNCLDGFIHLESTELYDADVEYEQKQDESASQCQQVKEK